MPGKTIEPPISVCAAPETEEERIAVRDQLERILANHLFKNSKRCPPLFRFVVEQTLEGRSAELKERTLGVDVFGRSPHYDTNLDPIVRTTAAEIRKRIAQYYHEPGHENELRIDLPIGSYVPEFRIPVAKPLAVVKQPVSSRRLPGWVVALGMLAPVAGLAFWLKPLTPYTAFDRFWAPVLESSNSMLVCVGQHNQHSVKEKLAHQKRDTSLIPSTPAESPTPITLFQLYWMSNQNMALTDATALTMVTGVLHAKGKTYRIRGDTSTTLEDLRVEPVILIGAFNNEWTMRLMSESRFSFERDGAIHRIRDRRDPGKRSWSVDYSQPYLNLTEDYAIITRVLDPTTERYAVAAAGIAGYGTMAAGEFLGNPAHMEAIVKTAPSGWDRKNIQVVIATKVINGNYGPPRVLAVNFW